MLERTPFSPEFSEHSPEYQEMLSAEIPEEKYPPIVDQIEQLEEWGIQPPMNNLAAQDMIKHVRSAMGMRGQYEGLHFRRIQEIIDMQSKWPRNKVIWGKPLILEADYDPRHGRVYKQKRSKDWKPLKIVDLTARTFEKKLRTREKMQELGIQREEPLADYKLRVLVKTGTDKFEVKGLSFAFIKRD